MWCGTDAQSSLEAQSGYNGPQTMIQGSIMAPGAAKTDRNIEGIRYVVPLGYRRGCYRGFRLQKRERGRLAANPGAEPQRPCGRRATGRNVAVERAEGALAIQAG